MALMDASKGIYSDEEYAKKFPGLTVYTGEESLEFPEGCIPVFFGNGFTVVNQPKESWLPSVEVAYFQGTCGYVKHVYNDKGEIA